MEVKMNTYLELPIYITGNLVPFIPASGPTFDCGGTPEEGGYCEDIQVFIRKGNVEITNNIPETDLEKLGEELYEDCLNVEKEKEFYENASAGN